jgi:hypothetical protein
VQHVGPPIGLVAREHPRGHRPGLDELGKSSHERPWIARTSRKRDRAHRVRNEASEEPVRDQIAIFEQLVDHARRRIARQSFGEGAIGAGDGRPELPGNADDVGAFRRDIAFRRPPAGGARLVLAKRRQGPKPFVERAQTIVGRPWLIRRDGTPVEDEQHEQE